MLLLGLGFVLKRVPKRRVKTRTLVKLLFMLGLVGFVALSLQIGFVPTAHAAIVRVQVKSLNVESSVLGDYLSPVLTVDFVPSSPRCTVVLRFLLLTEDEVELDARNMTVTAGSSQTVSQKLSTAYFWNALSYDVLYVVVRVGVCETGASFYPCVMLTDLKQYWPVLVLALGLVVLGIVVKAC